MALKALSSNLYASQTQQIDLDALLDEVQAAQFLGVSPRCLQGWRQRGGNLHFVKISLRCIRYRRKDLIAFAEARLRSSTSDPGNMGVEK